MRFFSSAGAFGLRSLRHALLATVLVLVAGTSGSAAPKPPSSAMKSTLKHHVVRFPDCQISFDYPAELTPSREFFMQRMESEVDYATIGWFIPAASKHFISMTSDLRSGFWKKVVASVSIEMWLGAGDLGFEGDMRKIDDLKRAHVQSAVAAGNPDAHEPLEVVAIGGREWVYVPSARMYLTALNSRYYVRARVSSSVEAETAAAREWASRAYDTVLGSVRVEAIAPVAAVAP